MRTDYQPASLYTTQGQRKYINAAERLRFLAAAGAHPDPKARSFCLTLAYSGCRISEALALRGTSVEHEGEFAAIRSLKKRGLIVVREIPLPPHVLSAITEAQGGTATERLWPWSRCHAWQLVKQVMRSAGIGPGIHATPKGLRHGFGLHAISSGVPLNLVQRWLGHSRMETTAIYLQAIGQEEREIAARMWC